MDDPLTWTETESEAWIEKPEEERLADIRRAQSEAFSIRPGFFNRRKWTEASMRFARLVLLQLRASARLSVEKCAQAAAEGRVTPDVRELLDERGEEFIPTFVGVAFTKVEEGFANHDWSGSGVSSPEQTTRLLFVGERLRDFIDQFLKKEGLRQELLTDIKGFVERQLQLAFTTPSNQPLPKM
jgi:hypothetical protein